MRKLLQSVAAAALAVTFAGPVAAESVFKVVVHADLKNTDPIWTTALITGEHGYNIYDTLFATDDDLAIQPQMAEGYTVTDDGLLYTITLRDGLKWHDGAPVTAKDCVASIARWGQRDGMGQILMSFLDKMEVVNEKTFTIRLKEPWAPTITALGKPNSNIPFMMPERSAMTDAHEQVKEQIGSGPFKFVPEEWTPGSKVVYVKNEDYVPRAEPASNAAGGKVVHFDRLEWLYIPDANTANNALINGEVDLVENAAADHVPMLRASDGVTVAQTDKFGWQPWFVINHLHEPTSNVKFRQALQYMVDQATYQQANSTLEGSWRTCGALMICDARFGSTTGSERVMTQDFEAAKKLLKEAGYNNEKVILMHPTDIPQLNSASVVTAQLLRNVGINVDVQAMDWSTLTSRRAEKKAPEDGGWHLFHTAWPASTLMNPLMHNGISGACGDAWFGWHCDQELQDLRAAYSRTADPAKQEELAEKMQARAMEIVSYIPLGQYFFFRAYRDNVTGVIPSVISYFWNIQKN
ncbi:MAG: ABC transporter substrate-binding protein [Alphaproteobacteria bacterium]